MIGNIRKEDFGSIFFEAGKISSRVSLKELSHFMDNENVLRDMIFRKKDLYQSENKVGTLAAYERLEEECQINVDTMRKTISGSIKVTRNFLYKFAVGLHMSLEEANQYFELNGGGLRESCLADYICIHALHDQDDIKAFISEFEKHTESKIGMRERRAK